jgi:hypothetical protein
MNMKGIDIRDAFTVFKFADIAGAVFCHDAEMAV